MRSLVRRLSPAVQWMLAVALLAAAGVVLGLPSWASCFA